MIHQNKHLMRHEKMHFVKYQNKVASMLKVIQRHKDSFLHQMKYKLFHPVFYMLYVNMIRVWI